jgi:RNase P subunit RPR2
MIDTGKKMMICKKCNGTDIKSRRNYSHGKKSKPTTTYICRGCGSSDVEIRSNNRRGRRR